MKLAALTPLRGMSDI